jgi:hypothetical protein
VVVYTSSCGNYFFREVGELLVAGFKEVGCRVELRTEKDGFETDVHCYVVVAPHEFFYLGSRIELQRKRLPGNLILLNTEQPSTRPEKFSSEYAARPVLGGSLATSPPHALRKTAFDSPRLLNSERHSPRGSLSKKQCP